MDSVNPTPSTDVPLDLNPLPSHARRKSVTLAPAPDLLADDAHPSAVKKKILSRIPTPFNNDLAAILSRSGIANEVDDDAQHGDDDQTDQLRNNDSNPMESSRPPDSSYSRPDHSQSPPSEYESEKPQTSTDSRVRFQMSDSQ